MRFAEPFKIAGYSFEAMPSVLVRIGDGQVEGRGEAAGVYYRGDDQAHVIAGIATVRDAVAEGATRDELARLLPPGGARNAIDCAMWELESRLSGQPVWAMAGIGQPVPMVTTFTLPADELALIERKVGELDFASAIKLKFDGDFDADTARLALVRRLRPDVWIAVDANQGYTADDLDRLERLLVDSRVGLLEQPVARGAEDTLAGWRPPFPVAADESILDLAELETLGDGFDVINIKLDKCGGLTEALAMARRAKAMGKEVMVGNMGGSALAMAPAYIVAQLCTVVDLDGPWGLGDTTDIDTIYKDGKIVIPSGFWGA